MEEVKLMVNSFQNGERLLVFMHIPKTGGSTLREIVARQYKSNEVWTFGTIYQFREKIGEISKDRIAQIKGLQGHACFGEVHRPFDKPFTYITMLRDPVERIISLHRRHGIGKNLSLNNFVTNPQFQFATRNTQTRYASAMSPPNLERAKNNFENYFAVVGITEMFDESIFMMKKKLGWGDINYRKKNVTSNRPTREEVSNKVIEIIKEKNELDTELYNYAKERLKTQIQALDSNSKQELKDFLG